MAEPDSRRWFSDDRTGEAPRSLADRLQDRAAKLKWLRLLAPEARRVGYLGWLGHRNVGDEVMYEAAHLGMPRARVRELPPLHLLARMQSAAPRPLVSALMLGGGTLIGHADFRRPFEDLWRRHPDVPAFTFGSGVEDPALDRAGVSSAERQEELARWGELLARFDTTAVRGPRSAALLQAVGVEPEVVGDPALLLRALVPDATPQDRVLGINAGITGNLWGGDPERVLDELAATLRTFRARGWTVRLFSVWPADEPYLRELARRADLPAELIAIYEDTSWLLRELQACTVFAGLKLHSVVLASAAGVPSVMIEYLPKCRDFMESIGRGAFTIRTDELDTAALTAQLDALAEDRDAQSAAVVAAVDGHRETLGRLCRRIEERVGA